MSYSTPAMVRKALVPSSDGTETSGTGTAADLTDPELQDAIDEADSTIDGYLSRFYATPVAATGDPAATPHPIDYWSRNIAAYNATLAFRGSQDFADTDPIARRYTATMQALLAVSTGKVGLSITENSNPDTGAAGAGTAINPPTMGDLAEQASMDHTGRFGYGWPGEFVGIWVDRDRYAP